MSSAAASWAPWAREAAAPEPEEGERPRLPPWEPGEPLLETELMQIYRRAFGRELPQGRVGGGLVAALQRHMGTLRFDFEINRLRGYALEQ